MAELSSLIERRDFLYHRLKDLEKAKYLPGAPPNLHELEIANLLLDIFVYESVITATKDSQKH